ncbi:GDSL-like Lipase/Acylhydrolase [bacterium BMS3Abin02]|nr:GDSL-like Lipase/Acylhydrolase [bacterium BMS3Abin02]GBE21596.1 GDSL-like Lipase/Acylhydrolase [bacterium BMS3Bbin01]
MRRTLRAAGLIALAWSMGTAYTRWHSLPSFQGSDASGVFGDAGLAELSIVVLGDSSCTGPGLERPQDVWIQRIGRELGQRFHVTLDSFAIGGSKTRDVLTDQVPKAIERRYDLAIVSVGGNDMLFGVPIASFHRQLASIVDALTPSTEAIVLSGVGDMGSIPRLPLLLRWPAHARGRAADRTHARVAENRPNVFKVPLWNFAEAFHKDLTLWSPDLFHASSRGHALFAEAALPTITEALEYLGR